MFPVQYNGSDLHLHDNTMSNESDSYDISRRLSSFKERQYRCHRETER